MSHMPRFSLAILHLLLLILLLPCHLCAARNDPGGRQAAGVHLPTTTWKLCLLVALSVATVALLAALIVFVCRHRNQNASVAVAVSVPLAVAPAPQISDEKRQVDKPKPKRWSTHLRPSLSPRNPMSINPTMMRTPSPYRPAASRSTDPDTDEVPTFGEWQSSSEQSSSDSYVAMFYKKVRASSWHRGHRPPRPAQVACPLPPAGPSEQAPSPVVLGSPALVRAYMIEEETVIWDPLARYSPAHWVRLTHLDYNQLESGTKELKRKSMPDGHVGPWNVVLMETQFVDNEGLPAKVTIKRHHTTFTEVGCKRIREELKHICTLRHRNLVKLHGYTLGEGRLYLVYDYMPNGSLENHLFPANGVPVLDWQSRYSIAKEVAQGLDPLHVSDAPHGSISVSSIMLDHDYTACLDDHFYYRLDDDHFCNSRAIASASTTAETGASLEADIADLGAVFLELVCGRRRTDTDFSGNEKMTLVDWVWALYGEAYKEPDDVSEGIIQRRVNEEILFGAVDRMLNGEIIKAQALKLVILGLACSHPDSMLRPKIRDVRMVLLDMNPVPRLPLSKPTCV